MWGSVEVFDSQPATAGCWRVLDGIGVTTASHKRTGSLSCASKHPAFLGSCPTRHDEASDFFTVRPETDAQSRKFLRDEIDILAGWHVACYCM